MNGYRDLIRRLRQRGWDDGARLQRERVPESRKREIEDEIKALQAWAEAVARLSRTHAEPNR